MQKYKLSIASKLFLGLAIMGACLGLMNMWSSQVEAQSGTTAAECRASTLTNDNFNDKGVFEGYDDYRERCACKDSLAPERCGITSYLQLFINVLSGLVGVVIVIMVAVGGVQYASSRDNPQQTAAAKNRIRDALLALVIFIFTFAFLQWLVPGGVF